MGLIVNHMDDRLKILQVVKSVDNLAAGTSYSVPALADAIQSQGAIATLTSLGSEQAKQLKEASHRPFEQSYKWVPGANKLGFSNDMRQFLSEQKFDIIHTHGLWTMPNVYPAKFAMRHGSIFVLSPRGMLGEDALQFSKLKKKMFWVTQQKRAVRSVACFHATAESEVCDIRNFGLEAPVAVIPNGIDLPELSLIENNVDSAPYLLSLGRIHPKKGLDRLIAAWARVSPDYPTWRLKIVGPDECGHAQQLSSQAHTLGVSASVSIEAPVFGREKNFLMRHAKAFVLPTLHENFALTVAESLSLETPVISTKGAPWSGLIDERCGWWIEHGGDSLSSALRDAMSTPETELKLMGERGRAWMRRDFSWDAIGAKMLATYAWLKEVADKPSWVAL